MLKLDVSCRTDDNDYPLCALVNIDDTAISRIRLFAAFVKENNLYRVEGFDCSPTWYNVDVDEGEHLSGKSVAEIASVECVCLNVSENSFWWSAFLKNSDLEIETDKTPIQAKQTTLAA